MSRVQKARQALRDAEKKLIEEMTAMFKPGFSGYYIRAKEWIPCTVIQVSPYGDRVKVRGLSHKEYWVSGYRMRDTS